MSVLDAGLSTAPLLVLQHGRVTDSCGTRPLIPCKIMWEFSPATAADLHRWDLDVWTNKIVAIVFTVVIALILRRIAHALISRVATRMATGGQGGGRVASRLRTKTKTILEGSAVLLNERRRQRAETMGSLLRSVASVVILGSATITILGEVGLNLAPFLASAGIVGVAVAFGAQNLVKDFLSGVFMLLEDQYGVGDVIDVGPAKGTVEEVTLRVTKLRDVNGVAWYVRNGTIQRVGNESQNWARVVLDMPVAVDQDLDEVRDLLQAAADGLATDEDWAPLILEDPSVWGIQEITHDAVVVRVTLKTAPGEQGKIARELRARVKAAFDGAGVSVAALADK